MEKHKCKLCLRSFANGRALGGHMRSHMMNLPVPPKESEFVPVQLSFEAESSPSQSSSSFYGLRENPKKSFRFADPEFSFAAETGSVILQDRESETESSKNPTRKRSKRAWQLGEPPIKMKLCGNNNNNKNESASSASDTTTEEAVAFCLMMLSRDRWKKYDDHKNIQQYDDEVEEDDDDDDEEEDEEEDDDDEDDEEKDGFELEEMKSVKRSNKVRGRYKCETCDKVFRSYQALGGHRASHKKMKLNSETEFQKPELESEHAVVSEKKIHECPVCFRVFGSGQALGGHKRTHVIGSSATHTTATVRTSATASVKVGDSLIDLNLPAPVDDDDEDISQFDHSALSDAEFVKE